MIDGEYRIFIAGMMAGINAGINPAWRNHR